ncbi:hypothetical protein [Legionella bononiensis]|uniref:Integral membrane protein n=1 Tax=Legionella bononiensis TaxID=2793102 RepID=A0ABS1WEI4_9GAMM|nr:hypothetical protein [Legionella bononiensis]MBL7479320.1 hypothetical protein [Legionella bononiensis]MBL7479360.1 hypothetical protein [Legionella bononiensis]MBL7527776.1 hypothetical protein [Legionella bononiensis]MBL7563543.1 hypothetical protein [Legionella bononiensis]
MEYQRPMIRFQILFVIIGTPVAFYLDGVAFNNLFPYGQWMVNFCIISTFFWFYRVANKQLQSLMLLMILISSSGEIIASLMLKFYVYRLDNIPLYVPFGHALVFATSYYIYQQTFLQKYAPDMERLLFIVTLLISVLSFIILQDTLGVICFVIFCLLRKNNKLFYSCMFFMVLYLELLGTHMHTWTWYGKLNIHPDWVNCANPPSAIGGLYMILDALVTLCYFQLNTQNIVAIKNDKE